MSDAESSCYPGTEGIGYIGRLTLDCNLAENWTASLSQGSAADHGPRVCIRALWNAVNLGSRQKETSKCIQLIKKTEIENVLWLLNTVVQVDFAFRQISANGAAKFCTTWEAVSQVSQSVAQFYRLVCSISHLRLARTLGPGPARRSGRATRQNTHA